MVLAPEGAVAVRTVHISDDRKWDTEFVSRVEGATWDFPATTGDDTKEVDFWRGSRRWSKRSPIKFRTASKGEEGTIAEQRKGAQAVRKSRGELCFHALSIHTVDACRERMERLMMQDPVGADRVVRTKRVMMRHSHDS